MTTSASIDALGGLKTAATASSTGVGSVLGKDDFLRLLVLELQQQDPMNPQDEKESLAQMAQFSTLEQITNVSNSIQALAFNEQATQAVQLVGRTVKYTKADGSTGEGAVELVSFADGNIKLKIGDDSVLPNAILEVK